MIDKKTIINFCKKYSHEQFLSPENKISYSLWPSEQIDELNSRHKVEEFIPGFIGFGTSGGGELLAVNTKDGKIYSIPFTPMGEKEAVQIAKDIDEFVGYKK